MRGMGGFNYPLALGLLLTLILGGVALFGPMLAPHDPMAANQMVMVGKKAVLPPFRPFTVPGIPLGSDEVGRDVLSRLLWAVRPTLVLSLVVVAARLALGIPLGLIAGWYGGAAERVIDALISAGVSVPMLILSIAGVTFMGQESGLLAFVVGLSFLGWADTAVYVKNQTVMVRSSPFIESARAVGARSHELLANHLFPQLWPILPVLIAFELSAVTLLVAELGFLGLYIGGGFIYDEPMEVGSGSYFVLTAGYPELGQMLSGAWAKIVATPWLLVFASLVIFMAVFAFNLLGEGLRRQMDVTRPRRRSFRWWRRAAPKPVGRLAEAP